MTETQIAHSELRLTFSPLAESAVLVRIGAGELIDPVIVDAVTSLTHTIDHADLPGVVNVVPAYATILIEFDSDVTTGDDVEVAVREIAARGFAGPDRDVRTVIIPVMYGGEFGPDLPEMANEVGMHPDDLVHRHAQADYRVACMGFSPGWAYLLGLPVELTVPRLRIPRTRIPAGSVAVGGAQTGVYPLESPGGWRLIGRTPLRMFDPDRSEPFLLQPGNHVRFASIDHERFAMIQQRGSDE